MYVVYELENYENELQNKLDFCLRVQTPTTEWTHN